MVEATRFSQFQRTLDRVLKNIKKLEMSYMRGHGLRSVHTSIMLALDEEQSGLTVTQISRKCEIDKALITRTASDLLNQGYIMPTVASGDNRQNRRYVLTQNGQSIICDMKSTIAEYVRLARTDMTEADIDVFYSVLDGFDRNIESITKQLPK